MEYNDLIVDFRGISELKKLLSTILDADSFQFKDQNPNFRNYRGSPERIESLAKLRIVEAILMGCSLEAHTNPSESKK